MAQTSRQFIMQSRPSAYPEPENFRLVETPLRAPGDGEVLVATKFLSLDPYMRGRMNAGKSYAAGVEIGGVMVGGTVGEVVESKASSLAVGDPVVGSWGWQSHAVVPGAAVTKVNTTLAPIQAYLSVLGMPGMTAYFGLLDVCEPREGETVFVSGAAGAVGTLVGQIAKLKGCRVVGSAGSDDKVEYLIDELGFDGAFNYKTVDDYVAHLRVDCPNGIDCYFDNVGGPLTDAVFMCLNDFARVSICGQISQYNVEKPEMGPRILLTMLLVRQATARGFIVSQFQQRFPKGMAEMAQWLTEGKLKYREDIAEGLEHAPEAFIGMLKGANRGKQLVKVG